MCKIISTCLIDVLPPAKNPLGTRKVVHEPSLPIELELKGCWHSSHFRLSHLCLPTEKNKQKTSKQTNKKYYVFHCSRHHWQDLLSNSSPFTFNKNIVYYCNGLPIPNFPEHQYTLIVMVFVLKCKDDVVERDKNNVNNTKATTKTHKK